MTTSEQTRPTQGDRGQVSSKAAEVYEEYFVPALFQPWAPRLVDAAHIAAGQRVLDVACGTGILARTAAERVGPAGSVVGLDINEGMLAVARRIAPHIEWRHDRAESLPFADESFDAVVSQFGLMFFEDKPGALREMWRVLRPGGRLAVAVWDSFEKAPSVVLLAEQFEKVGSPQAVDALKTPFSMGHVSELQALFARAGVSDARVDSHLGYERYPSFDRWVQAHIKGWVFAEMLDEAQYARLVSGIKEALKPYVKPDGTVVAEIRAHIITAHKVSGSNGRMA